MVMNKFLIALFLLFSAGTNLHLLSQETLPDTVWTKQMDEVNVVKFSPDGKYVFASTKYYGVHQLDALTGNLIRTILLGNNQVGFSPTGDTVVLSAGNQISLININTGEIIDTFLFSKAGNPDCEALITPDGKRIITTTGNEPKILVIDIKTRQIIKEFVEEFEDVTKIEISKNGLFLVIKDFRIPKSMIFLLDLTTYQDILLIDSNDNFSSNNDISFSNNNLVAYNSAEKIKIWNSETHQLVHTCAIKNPKLNEMVTNLAFTNDSKYIIFGNKTEVEHYSENYTAILDYENDSIIYKYPYQSNKYGGGIDVSKDDKIVITDVYGKVTLLRPKWNGTSVQELKNSDFDYLTYNGKLYINFKEILIEEPNINIFDINGKPLKNINILNFSKGTKSLEMDISFLIPGVYLIEINVINKHYSFKLLVQ